MIFIILNIRVQAETLTVIGADIAGVFKKKKAKSSLRTIDGREERIIKAIFKCMKVEPKFILSPFGRHLKVFNDSKENLAVTTVYEGVKLNGHSSESHITYYNGLSSLKRKVDKISSISELKGKRIISFVGAKKMFPKLAAIIPSLKYYSENSNQAIHSKMLYSDRVDFVISDAVIFAHHTAQLQQLNPKKYTDLVGFKQVFKPSKFKMFFKEKRLRNDFNQCLKKLRKNGQIERLNIEYYNELIINK